MRLPARLAGLSLLAAGTFAADLATKRLLFWPGVPGEPPPVSVVIPGFFSIAAARNTGGVFGLLTGVPCSNWIFISIAVAASFFLVRLAAAPECAGPMIWGIGLVLGGALGNLWDRLWFGSVRDFLLFYVGSYRWPNFNLADSAICVGTVLLGWAYWKKEQAAGLSKV